MDKPTHFDRLSAFGEKEMRSFITLGIVLFVCACNNSSEPKVGPQGPKGESGKQGLQGDPGPQGEKGLKGDQGATGLQGLKGDKGDQGDVGLQGPQGITGPKGESGTNGIPCSGKPVEGGILITCGTEEFLVKHGENGAKGEKGSQGLQGQQGVQGKSGTPGKDLIAQCPEGAQPMVFNGHLMYCAKKIISDVGLTPWQCRNICLNNGLAVARIEDVATMCLGDPSFFDEQIKIGEGDNSQTTCTDGLDNDKDSFVDCKDSDCKDSYSCFFQNTSGIRFLIQYGVGVGDTNTLKLVHFGKKLEICPAIEKAGKGEGDIEFPSNFTEGGLNPSPKGCLCGKPM